MENTDTGLDALTNQRVAIRLGDKTYTARRATLKDFSTMMRYLRDRGLAVDDISANLDSSLFLLTELMKPETTITPEELAETLPFSALEDVTQALVAVGFVKPQAIQQEEK